MLNKNQKQKSEELEGIGVGLPFFVPAHFRPSWNDKDRQTPIYIDLADLNNDRGMPVSFDAKKGRILPSYDYYWTEEKFADAVNLLPDIL